jgi:hypothetical protein
MEAFTFLLPFPVACGNWSLIFIPVIVFSIIFTSYHTFSVIRYPSNLPLANEPAGKRSFSWRTRWRYYTDCESLYQETYDKVSPMPRPATRPSCAKFPHSHTNGNAHSPFGRCIVQQARKDSASSRPWISARHRNAPKRYAMGFSPS